jgi:hypothetical protein
MHLHIILNHCWYCSELAIEILFPLVYIYVPQKLMHAFCWHEHAPVSVGECNGREAQNEWWRRTVVNGLLYV